MALESEVQAAVVMLPYDLSPVQLTLMGVVISLLAAKLVQWISLKVVARLIHETETDLDNIVFSELYTPVYVSVAVIGLYLSMVPLGLGSQWMYYLRAVAFSVTITVWALAVLRMGRRFFEKAEGSSRFDHEFMPVFENLWTIIVLVGAVFSYLTVWNIDITPLLASAGIAGVAVGFAARDTVANFFGGIALYFDDTYKLGDYVVLDDGDAGTVIDIGVRSTVLRTRNDVLLTVPNSVLNSAKITNESAPETWKRVKVPVGVAYGTDIDQLEEILLEIAEGTEDVLADPAPQARFRGFGESSLDYELWVWVPEPLKDRKVTHRLNRQIYEQLNAADIEIPFPQRVLHMQESGVRERPQDARGESAEGGLSAGEDMDEADRSSEADS